ncbi:hypothetical protein [Corynebacterium efficiens YS-314]|uniref:Uncharacterized protein n=1 Tax=Corynebacterium efficiens (strain DSM 44549 / YS-314 / AJ 12310 / JCM 11189 / NBRC 100395) TaxID=196164 RepID=Q8FLR5_COREF|nr:hypothetical protein [Corynebacterium efficiens YS-314]
MHDEPVPGDPQRGSVMLIFPRSEPIADSEMPASSSFDLADSSSSLERSSTFVPHALRNSTWVMLSFWERNLFIEIMGDLIGETSDCKQCVPQFL